MNSSIPAPSPSSRREYAGAPALADGQGLQQHDGGREAGPPRLQQRQANPPHAATGGAAPDAPAGPAPLSSGQAQLLITLRGQINAIRPPLAPHLEAIVAVFASIKESEHALKDLLRFYPSDPQLAQCRSSLSRLIGEFNAALGAPGGMAGAIEPGLLSNRQIQLLCQGLAAGIPPTGSLLFYKNPGTQAVLRNLTDILLTRAMAQGLPEAVQANGEVLDILNWLSRGLKAGLLVASEPIDRCFGKALLLIHEWTGGDQCRQLLTDHNLGRCAVQLATIINHTGIDLLAPAGDSAIEAEQSGQARQAQPQTMGEVLQRCVLQLCAPAVLKRLATAPVDAIALLNVCNMVKYAVEKRVLAANDPLLLPVLNLVVKTIGMLPEQELVGIEGDCRPLSNFSNFLRTLAGDENRQQLEFQAALSMLDPVCAHLLSCVNGQAFEDAWPSSQSLSNLISFVKFCDRMLERRTAATSTAATTTASTSSTTSTTAATPSMQAALIKAAGRLSAGVLWYGAAAFDGPPALGGLLAGLAYLWQRNLVPVTAAMAALAKDLLARVGQTDAGAWSDKSKRVILPPLNVLLTMRVITLEQAQAALARLLPASGRGTGQLTLQDMASEIARLGAVEDVVSALPMALPASPPGPALPPAISGAPRTVPGWTAIRPAPPAPPATAARKTGAARSKNTPSRRSVGMKPQQAHAGRGPAQARSESARHSPRTATASMPSYIPPAKVTTQVQESGTQQQKSGDEASPTPPEGSSARPKKSNNAKPPANLQSTRAYARSALSQAILAGQVDAVSRLFRQKASWSGKEIAAVLHEAMGGIELMDAPVLHALDAFFTAVRVAQPEAGPAVLTKYFKTHPPIFASLPSLLASHGLIAAEDSVASDRRPETPSRQTVGALPTQDLAVSENDDCFCTNPNELMIKARHGDTDGVEQFLAAGSAAFTATLVTGEHINALMLAARHGHTDVVRLLLSTGTAAAQVGRTSKFGMNALMLAAAYGHADVVRQLLDVGLEDKQGWAVNKQGEIDWVVVTEDVDANGVRLLPETKSTITQASAVDMNGRNALMFAAKKGHANVVKLLLDTKTAEAQASALNAERTNALMFAAFEGHADVVRMLLAMKSGDAQACQVDAQGATALLFAVNTGHADVVRMLLAMKSAGTQVNTAFPDGMNALMLAAGNGNTEIVRLLLATGSAGAQANAVNIHGLNASSYARLRNFDAIVRLLEPFVLN